MDKKYNTIYLIKWPSGVHSTYKIPRLTAWQYCAVRAVATQIHHVYTPKHIELLPGD